MATHYRSVPTDFIKNLEFRSELRHRAKHSQAFRQDVIQKCKEDTLFFLNSLCWLYEPRPRPGRDKMIPFIAWKHQVPIIKTLSKNLGFCDCVLEKSRGEGASWIAILLAVRDWIFDPMSKVGMVSRTEEVMDSPDDPDSLFWKIHWEVKQLPKWLVGEEDRDWKRSITEHTIVSHRTGAVISGYASTGNVGRGGRYKWFFMDELSSFPKGADKRAVTATQQATESRLIASTPEGSSGAFYDAVHRPSNKISLRLHWADNPSRNRGLYRFKQLNKGDEKVPVPVDAENGLPENYFENNRDLFSRLRENGFNLYKGLRSPWYDNECDRMGASPKAIAQELDIDYSGSLYRIFNDDVLEIVDTTTRWPVITGEIFIDPEELKIQTFERRHDGPVSLWLPLDYQDKPAFGTYVFGADVSTGVSASNSALIGMCTTTGEQVFEFVTSTLEPYDFADFSIAVAKWFNNAYLAWEHNGPGTAFTRRVLDSRYPHIYKRTKQWVRGNKKTAEPGFWTDQKTKGEMFQYAIRQIKDLGVTVRSENLRREFTQYIFLNGKIEHQVAATTKDDGESNAAHGDRVIAFGVMMQASKDFMVKGKFSEDSETNRRNPPNYTMARRMKDLQDRERKSIGGWDYRTTASFRR